MAILVYGATGRTGRAVARALVDAGRDVVIGGRSAGPVREVARELGVDARVATVEEVATILSPDLDAVVNVAGPFVDTVTPVASAAAAAGIHYIDLANELPAVEALRDMSGAFADAGRLAVPAAGFGTIATDAAAATLIEAVPGITSLELAMLIDSDGQSAGAAQSAAAALARPAIRLDDGRAVEVPARGRVRRDPDSAFRSILLLGLADLVVTPLTTGVTTVSVGAVLPVPALALRAMLPALSRGGGRRRGPARPSRREPRSRAWAYGRRADGQPVTAELTAGDGYEFSARAAAATVIGVLESTHRVGFSTAVGLLGPDLARAAGANIRLTTGTVHAAAE